MLENDEKLTVEDTNLMCIFAGSSGANARDKATLIEELMNAAVDFVEKELITLCDELLAKLDKMSDDEFAALPLYPVYDDYNDYENYDEESEVY